MRKKGHPIKIIIFLSILAIVFAVLSISIGAIWISPIDIILSLFGKSDGGNTFILKNYRLPRMILSILIGSGLAVAGGIFQGVLSNPMASLDVIGITKGAGLAAAFVLILFPKAPVKVIPISALAGAALITLFIYLFSLKKNGRPAVIALVGVALGAICNAAIQYLMVRNPISINVALIWLSGSLWGKSMVDVFLLLPWTIIFLPMAFLAASKLDVLGLGDEVASGLGENVKALRVLLLVLAVILTGSSVAISGTIGFIGLIAPHMARKLVGSKHKFLIPASAILGSILLLVSDSIGKGIFAPVEVPTGVVTAIIGAPYFLYLLIKSK